jgi:hypothetical protein
LTVSSKQGKQLQVYGGDGTDITLFECVSVSSVSSSSSFSLPSSFRFGFQASTIVLADVHDLYSLEITNPVHTITDEERKNNNSNSDDSKNRIQKSNGSSSRGRSSIEISISELEAEINSIESAIKGFENVLNNVIAISNAQSENKKQKIADALTDAMKKQEFTELINELKSQINVYRNELSNFSSKSKGEINKITNDVNALSKSFDTKMSVLTQIKTSVGFLTIKSVFYFFFKR